MNSIKINFEVSICICAFLSENIKYPNAQANTTWTISIYSTTTWIYKGRQNEPPALTRYCQNGGRCVIVKQLRKIHQL